MHFDTDSLTTIPYLDRKIKNLTVKCPNSSIIKTKSIPSYLDKENVAPQSNNRSRRRSRRLKGLSPKHITSTTNNSRKRRFIEISDDKDEKNNIDAYDDNPRKKAKTELKCSWIGRYGDLETHLNQCVVQIPIDCPQCGEKGILRRDLALHIEELCEMTEIECEDCGGSMMRNLLEHHQEWHCPETVIECEYKDYGCEEVLTRREMWVHIERDAEIHLSLVKDSMEAEIGEMQAEINALRRMVKEHMDIDSNMNDK